MKRDKKKESKIKKFIAWFKESWKEPRKQAFLKLGLYGVFFATMFLLLITTSLISKLANNSEEPKTNCIGIFCNIRNNNYEYKFTIKNYEQDNYMTYVELNGYKNGKDNYYKELTNEDTFYFKYIENVVYEKINNEWLLAKNDNIYTNNDYIFLDSSNLELLVNMATLVDSSTSFDGTEKNDTYSITITGVNEFLSQILKKEDMVEIKQNSLNDVKIVVKYKNNKVNTITIDFKAINNKDYNIEYRNIDKVTESLINDNFK